MQELKNFYNLYRVPHSQNFQFILTVLLEICRTVEDQMLCLLMLHVITQNEACKQQHMM